MLVAMHDAAVAGTLSSRRNTGAGSFATRTNPRESAVPGTTPAPSTAQAEPASAPPAMFAALAVPNFRPYAERQALSLIGTWVAIAAQALLVTQMPGPELITPAL